MNSSGRRLALHFVWAAWVCCACNQHLGEWVDEEAPFVDTSHLRDAGGDVDRTPSSKAESAANDRDDGARARPVPPAPPPPSATPGPRCKQALAEDTCLANGSAELASEATVVGMDQINYFEGGAPLPPGKYRIAYVDGCSTFDIGVPGAFGWTVHTTTDDTVLGIGAVWLIADDTRLVKVAPGTTGVVPGMGAYATYGECVEANCSLPSAEFDFEGGRLGVRYGGIPLIYITGTAQGGRGPTFRITRIAPCP